MLEFRYFLKLEVKKGDNVFINYAGHGWYDDTFDIGYWITSEASKNPSTHLDNNKILNLSGRWIKKRCGIFTWFRIHASAEASHGNT